MTDKMTKEEALQKIEELQKYVADKDIEVKGYVIKNRFNDSVIYVSKCVDLRDAVIEAVVSESNLRGANLCGADLSGADLRGANLREANLCGADLSGADLRGAYLTGANLREVDLCLANLRGADLQNAKFYGKGGTLKLKKSQVADFLAALGFQVED